MAKKGRLGMRAQLKRQTSLWGTKKYAAVTGTRDYQPKPVTLPKLKFMEGPDPEQLGEVRPAVVTE